MDSDLRRRFILYGGLLLAIGAVGLLVGSFYRETSRVTTLVLSPEISACEQDSDCVVVDAIGCCTCDAGGGQGAINVRMGQRLDVFLRGACRKGVPCVRVFACRQDLHPMCRHGRCTLAPPSARLPGEGDPLPVGG